MKGWGGVDLRRVLALMSACLVILMAQTSSAAATRFHGYISANGDGHHFVVGDGFTVVFRDTRHAGTPYRVCWARTDGRHRKCWSRTTGAKGQRSRVFTDAPNAVGNYVVRWRVHGKVVALWHFRNGVGD
jgi:hypothetical protein